MSCCEISDRAEMSKAIIVVRHFGLGAWSRITRNCCKNEAILLDPDNCEQKIAEGLQKNVNYAKIEV